MNDVYTKKMLESSHISGGSAEYVDALYEAYLKDANSVPENWRQYFAALQDGAGQQADVSHESIRDYFKTIAKQNRTGSAAAQHKVVDNKQAHVLTLINAYRLHGHHHADLDPLKLAVRKRIPDLDLAHHMLTDADMSTAYDTESSLCNGRGTLRDIFTALKRTYSNTVGSEYMHISDHEQVAWIQQQLEGASGEYRLTADEKKRVLKDLTAAEGLETFLGKKYVGQKRFSLEGGDSLIPLMNTLVEESGTHSVKEIVIGMAHRGRLNVLINVLGKQPSELYDEFEGKISKESDMSGDVKYHMGFSSDVQTASGNHVHLALAFNPSHLEIISPVVQGSARARLRRRDNLETKEDVVPIIIHGDAAFAGQGVVMETFNFSQARGYSTGGTVHIVVNNQIGFTTSNPIDSRSTLYCTDIAKMVQAPIFHVNADDPEAVAFIAKLAFQFRMKFKKDVVIDLVCYRRHGHNEADDPSVTQPLMYKAIKALPTACTQYGQSLASENVVTEKEVKDLADGYRAKYDKGEPTIKTLKVREADKHAADWGPYVGNDWRIGYDSTVKLSKVRSLWQKLNDLPEGFNVHRTVKRLLDDRSKMAAGEIDMNWGFAETMAYASLVHEGYAIRLSGQDSGRGTFSHRHAVLHDAETAETYLPLAKLSDKHNPAIVIDSVLSEEAVLGFEFGYATAEPNVLVIWEGQFGDFANGAQVVIDQFISSGEQKWGRLCGLVMFLPHGYEGQGPEHSSARLERYLQLCAQHNMQVCVPSTPAQVFHMLRRQMVRPFRKPLIVMTPKSLLRHKLAVSPLSDLEEGHFHLIIPEIDELEHTKVRKVVMCSGKVYYDLLQARREYKKNDVAIIRIEQLYPFPEKELNEELKKYPNAKEVVWCQEEPQNQGAWFCSQHHMQASLVKGQSLAYVGRGFSASPAVGNVKIHLKQQQALVDEALK